MGEKDGLQKMRLKRKVGLKVLNAKRRNLKLNNFIVRKTEIKYIANIYALILKNIFKLQKVNTDLTF